MTRVVCAGHVNWDVTLRVASLPAPDGEVTIADQSRAGGGSAANTAVALASLGIDATLLGSVGDDADGERARQELADTGVDCAPLQQVPGETTVKYLVVDEHGEVMVLANDGVNEAFSSGDLPEQTLASADHLHLTSQPLDTARDLLDRARSAGLSVSFDPGRRIDERDYEAVASRVDYLFCNDREAAVAREAGLIDSIEGRAVVTDGAEGGRFVDGPTHAGYDVTPLDTTGAGDAFAAGFLAAVLAGHDDAEALAVANASGALAAQSLGARATLSWDAIERLRDEQ